MAKCYTGAERKTTDRRVYSVPHLAIRRVNSNMPIKILIKIIIFNTIHHYLLLPNFNFMKNFLNDLLTFLIFVAAIVCFYFAAAVTFSSALFNFILFFAAIFFLIQGAGFIDRAKGFGKYAKENPPAVSDKENDSNNENDN